jgi:hypothetical protein
MCQSEPSLPTAEEASHERHRHRTSCDNLSPAPWCTTAVGHRFESETLDGNLSRFPSRKIADGVEISSEEIAATADGPVLSLATPTIGFFPASLDYGEFLCGAEARRRSAELLKAADVLDGILSIADAAEDADTLCRRPRRRPPCGGAAPVCDQAIRAAFITAPRGGRTP